jgi:hypothetical protein
MKRLATSLFLLITLLIVSCSKSDDSDGPAIEGIRVDVRVTLPGREITAECLTSGEDLSFEWGFTGLSSRNASDGSQVTIDAPDTPGYYSLVCTVRDADGNASTRGVTVRVVDSLSTVWNEALTDAANANSNEVVDDLVPITQTNSDLAWQTFDGIPYVLMVTYTSYSTYAPEIGDTLKTWWGDTWVTAAPEIQEYWEENCLDDTGYLPLRIRQILGLPAGQAVSSKSGDRDDHFFVEMWVRADDLLRPAYSNDIATDTSPNSFPAGTDQSYIDWFEGNMDYTSGGYPWTRLGYTYDWGNPDTDRGLSEFIVTQGAVVRVKAIYTSADYLETDR